MSSHLYEIKSQFKQPKLLLGVFKILQEKFGRRLVFKNAFTTLMVMTAAGDFGDGSGMVPIALRGIPSSLQR